MNDNFENNNFENESQEQTNQSGFASEPVNTPPQPNQGQPQNPYSPMLLFQWVKNLTIVVSKSLKRKLVKDLVLTSTWVVRLQL